MSSLSSLGLTGQQYTMLRASLKPAQLVRWITHSVACVTSH